MKKLTTLFLACFLIFGYAKAQYVNIPDSNFRKYLITQVPACINAQGQMDTTCSNVLNTKVLIMHDSIRDLSGIEYFKNLTDLYCYNNLITNLSNFPKSLTYLDCSNNLLTNLSNLPSSLTYLDCKLNQLTNLPTLPNSLLNLECSQNQLTSLPSLPNNLYTIDCSKNNLFNLPNLPDSLHELYCLNNKLTSLPALPAFLQLLSCDSNKLISLPNLPNTIQNIQVNSNQLTSLPTLPNSLIQLSCNSNPLINLPTLSPNLSILFCGNNQLSSLPNLPNSLTQLYSNNNQLNSLPSLPSSLQVLSIANNHFNVLPNLPTSLQGLYCSNNLLRSLPSLPSSLQGLSCDNNLLNNLPVIPNLLNSLSCSNNLLNSLPVLPNSLKYLICYSNSNLFCLPKLPTTLKQLVIDSSKIHCISNTVYTVYDSVGNLLNMPICNSTNNPNGCTLNGLSGNLVNIPDSNFAKYLISQIPSCLYKDSNNLYWMDTTCSGVLNLSSIYCNNLKIKSIEGVEYFKSLLLLNCGTNDLISMPTLPKSLVDLYCDYNQLTSLPTLPDSLLLLICNNNKLSNLPTLNNKLEYINCSKNMLTILPILPNFLTGIICSNNLLTSLPSLPNKISSISCGYNQLSKLPTLPNSISVIECENNLLTSLPTLPDSLHRLYCFANQLTNLPTLPDSLQILQCYNNQLVSLSTLPYSLKQLVCNGNPNLHCLPKLPNSLNGLNIDSSSIHCIPNFVLGLDINDSLGNLINIPVCNSTNNPNGCTVYGVTNYVNIPDSNFAKYLITQIPSCLYKDTNTNMYWMDTTCRVLNTVDIKCNNMNIKSIEGLEYFKYVRNISCDSNQLVSLPDLRRLKNLYTLSCKNNKLVTLPLIESSNYFGIDCSNNMITSLPKLSYMLYSLICNNNLMTSLPVFDYNIGYAEFKNNLITSLKVPGYNVLRYLYCDSNKITNVSFDASYLDSSSIVVLSLSGNSNLTCLPHLPYVQKLNVSGTNIACLPNIPPTFYNSPFQCIPANIPVCSNSYDPNNCTIYYNYVNIPDSNFAKYLLNKIPSCLFKDSSNYYWMDTTCSGVLNTTYIDVSKKHIANLTGIHYFNSLKTLYCDSNFLYNLELLPDSITFLSCSYNYLRGLFYLPNSINTLYCDNNLLYNLLNLPTNLNNLSCRNNKLTSLPSNLSNLNNLQELNCSNNSIKSLPSLPLNLYSLNCSYNSISVISSLPNNFYGLNCSHNFIKAFPTFNFNNGAYLSIDISNNLLASLPSSLDNFSYINCDSNQITVLNSIPPHIIKFSINYNQLTSLPPLNTIQTPAKDSAVKLSFCGNNIHCLQALPTVVNQFSELRIDTNKIKCLPNLPTSIDWNNQIVGTLKIYATPKDTVDVLLPVCNPTSNANQCQAFPIVHGKVFTDDNSNGIKDGNEYYRPFVQLNASNGTSVVTNTNGEYTLALTDTGTYTLNTVVPAGFKAVPASNTFSFNNNVASLSLPDIALQPINTNDSLTVFIMPLLWAKPGQEIQYFVSYENVGSVLANDTVKIVYDTAHLIFDSCSMPVISHNGNTIITSNNVLTPGDYNYFFAYFTVKQTVVLGDSVFATASIASTNTSASYLSYENVVSSYDPNYKDATPELSPVQVVNGTFIDYNIHFQNTGNDTAFNVVLADTLSPLLKSNILQVVATSHPCNITLKDSIIYFEFLKINLPDSNRNNFRSNGFVHFRLLPQNNVPAGGRINNKASIYFDYNKPVVTNTASTLIKPYGVPVVIRNYSVVAERVGENKLLEVINTWTVSTEINTAYYTIQRSITGRDFENVGKVIAKDARDYSFTDIPTTDATVIYYRLKITDKDGKIAYSDIKQIFIQPQTMFVSIYPNPAKNYFAVKGYNVSQINVVDNTGRKVMSRRGLNTNAVENKVNINVADGIYILQAIHTDGTIVNEKLIIKN